MKLRNPVPVLLLLLLFILPMPSLAIGDVITRDNASSLTLFDTFSTEEAVYSVTWMLDGSALAFGLADGTVMQEMLLGSDTLLPALMGGHTDAVTDVDVSSDQRWVFSVSMDGTVRAWESATGLMQTASGLFPISGDPFLLSVAARPDSPNEIAYAGQDSIVYQRVWNAPVRPGPPALSGHSNFVFDVEYSPDGNYLATGGADASVRVWSYASGTQQSSDTISHTERVYDVAFSPGGGWLASTGQDRRIVMSPVLEPGEPFLIAELPDPTGDTVINAIDVGHNGDIIAVGDSNGFLRIYSVPFAAEITARLLVEIDAHDDQIRDLAISPDGTMIATAGFDRTLKIWNIPTLGVPLAEPALPAPPAPITGDFCPGAPLSRLAIGMNARVTFTDGTPLRVRTNPGGDILTNLIEGATFEVIGGPLCESGFTWWSIELADRLTGWVAEGGSEDYYIEPLPGISSFASVSGVVWHDICDSSGSSAPEFCIAQSDGSLIADGFRASIEPVIAGVRVQIGNGACPAATAFAEVETGLDGSYQFTNLEAGTYCLFINPLYANNGLILIPGEWTFPLFFDPTSGTAYHTITLSAGMSLTDVEFGWDYQFLP